MFHFCTNCGAKYYKGFGTSNNKWLNRSKFCSRKCVNDFKIGKPAWNKGLTLEDNRVKKYALSQKGKKMSEETKRKMSMARKGKATTKGATSNFWKGGVTPLNLLIRSSFEYRLWREAVFTRDNYTCIWCGTKSGKGKKVTIQADHIKPFADYPELRFAIDNGRTLCIDCHRKTDTYGIHQSVVDLLTKLNSGK